MPSGTHTAPKSPGPPRRLRLLLALVVVLIVHGSLYPWKFAEPASFGVALAQTLGAGPLWTGRGDVLGNIALFVPLGVLMAPLMHRSPARSYLLALGGAAALAWGVQFLQIWVPDRQPSWADAAWNMVGLAIGMGMARAAVATAARFDFGAADAWKPAALMAGLWLGLQWWPFVPTLDWQHIKDALRPLLLQPRLTAPSLVESVLSTLVVAMLLRDARRRAVWLAALLVIAWTGKLFIAEQTLSASGVAGGALALALAPALWRLRASTAIGVTAAAAWTWFTVDALRPYELAESPSAFTWLPFVALLDGNLFTNLLGLLWNAFWTGAILSAAMAARARLGPLSVALASWVLLLEGAQTWLVGRVADSTAALLPLGWWLVARAFDGSAQQPAAARR